MVLFNDDESFFNSALLCFLKLFIFGMLKKNFIQQHEEREAAKVSRQTQKQGGCDKGQQS